MYRPAVVAGTQIRDSRGTGFVPLAEHRRDASPQDLRQTLRRRLLRSSPAARELQMSIPSLKDGAQGRRPGPGRNQHPHGRRGESAWRCSGRANHHHPVSPPRLPGGEPGSGPPPGRKFQQRTDMGEFARGRCQARPGQPKGILREHPAAREPQSNPATVSLSR
jgi:hypothetical protein